MMTAGRKKKQYVVFLSLLENHSWLNPHLLSPKSSEQR